VIGGRSPGWRRPLSVACQGARDHFDGCLPRVWDPLIKVGSCDATFAAVVDLGSYGQFVPVADLDPGEVWDIGVRVSHAINR
jgi:hypothetical protein